MNYKDKYLKYKLKYLNIKKNNNNLIGGTLNEVYDWNRLKIQGNKKLEQVIDDIKESPVILLVGHGEIEPKLQGEVVEDLDLKNKIVIGLDTFRRINYNQSFLDSLNYHISHKLKQNFQDILKQNFQDILKQNFQDIINIIQKNFNKFQQKTKVYTKNMPIKNFYIDLTKDNKNNVGIYYYTIENDKIKVNLLEYTEHYEWRDLKDIIDNFSNDKSKIFIVYSCHCISETKYLENSPELLTAQTEYGKKGPEEIPYFALSPSVEEKADKYYIKKLPSDSDTESDKSDESDTESDESDTESTEPDTKSGLVENKKPNEDIRQFPSSKSSKLNECETCKSFCNIQ